VKTRSVVALGVAVVLVGSVRAGEGGPAPVDLKDAPVNQWVERPVSGLKGQRITNRGGLAQGLSHVDGVGLVAVGDMGRPARAWRLDRASNRWVEIGSVPSELADKKGAPGYNWAPLTTLTAGDGRQFPFNEVFDGNQVCYDSDRKVIVGFARGSTVEFDVVAKRWRVVDVKVAPPYVAAGALCYDPVNKEVVLATGGFSPDGHPHGTWVYRAAERMWRRLSLGTEEVKRVRLRLQEGRDRLVRLRWLAWRLVEFTATGREGRLRTASRRARLAREIGILRSLIALLERVGEASATALQREYDRQQMASALRGLAAARDGLEGAETAFATGTAEPVEQAYREQLVSALDRLEDAAAALAVSPPPRMSAKLVYDSKNRAIVCFGGDRQDGVLGDTWVYHCEGRWWEHRKPVGHPSRGAARAMAFDEANGVVVLARGREPVWIYDVAANEWKRLDITAPKGAFWLEYDRAAECLVALSQDLTKTWTLRLDLRSAKAEAIPPSPEVKLLPVTGPYVLRDAATVADLKKWKAETDAWVTSVPANTWVPAPTHGTGRPNWGRSWSSVVYDPDRLHLIYRDGGHGSYHGAVTDHYDIPTGRWFRSARREEPPWPMGSYFAWGRSFRCAPWATHTYKFKLYYNPLVKRVQRLGVPAPAPSWDPARGMPVNDYNPDTGRWSRDFYFVPKPAPRGGWFPVPGTRNRLILIPFGRRDHNLGTVWINTGEGWKAREDVGSFPSVGYPPWEFQAVHYDPKRRRVLRMGPGHPPNHLWALDLDRPGAKWADLNATTDPPGMRLPETGRELVRIPRYDLFLMPDGTTRSSYRPDKVEPRTLAELCVYDPAKNTWRRFRTKFDPRVADLARRKGSDRSNGMVYDPVSDLIFFIGNGFPRSLNPPTLCALRFDPATADWMGVGSAGK